MTRPEAGVPGAGADDVRPRVTRKIAAEAATWIARLHGPSRDAQMEADCRAWQAQSPAHREAFEKCTDIWQSVPAAYEMAAADREAISYSRRGWADGEQRRRRRAVPRWGAALAMACLLVVGGAFFQQWRSLGEYSTGVGEQRVVMLEDGSRMLLNTDTRLKVDFGARQRTVSVRGGEALFEVAKDAVRPFVVKVAGSEVVAVGTAFSVRYQGSVSGVGDAHEALAVTLIEGKVNVRPASGAGAGLAPDKALAMEAGERVKLDGAVRSLTGAVPRVDRPNVEQVTAWKRSEAVFDAATLADAVAEMNRYNRTPIVLVGELASANLKVSGLFRTGDSAGFARAVAALHGLAVREEGGRLELAAPH